MKGAFVGAIHESPENERLSYVKVGRRGRRPLQEIKCIMRFFVFLKGVNLFA